MTYLLITYFLGLLYFSANPQKISSKGCFRGSWIWFSMIPMSKFVFTLFSAGNYRSPKALVLVEIWSNGIAWLLLGISLIFMINALIPDESTGSVASIRINDD